MSRLLLKIDRRTKNTEKTIIELKHERASVGVPGPSIDLPTLQNGLPDMPFKTWEDVIAFENVIADKQESKKKRHL